MIRAIAKLNTHGSVADMKTKPTTFPELLSLWPSPKDLSLALGVPYINAQQMKMRKSVSVKHWPQLIQAARAEGVKITSDDLVAMRLRKIAA